MSSETRARSDAAVRRLREESRLRIDGQSRRRSFAGWCAVATLASGISLAAMNAHDARLERRAELTTTLERDVRIETACAGRDAVLAGIDRDANEALARAKDEGERRVLAAGTAARRVAAINAAAAEGCGERVPPFRVVPQQASRPGPATKFKTRHVCAL